ncbi:HIT-like protein [Daedalea quercina L-15889]|uniref:HIT-like protein n=1 Tax=Daedalea quercina L-15889 TaxID=1314783 RepID=A0A165P5A6_9APHY|nr:HIT-like protein [Daedalea quercina L-15889]
MPLPSPTILRSYAQRPDPSSLPASVLLTHTDHTLTIFDAYPKSIFHFLVLPRVIAPSTASDLTNLRTVLKGDKSRAQEVIRWLAEDGMKVRSMIQDEMLKRYHFKWNIWMGFHAVPSMEHIHLHVLSADLCSPAMKNKKHYNSFHPKRGFFISLSDVQEWLEADPSYFSTMSQLKPSQYEPLLKEPLECWRCNNDFKTMPLLKAHLQGEWEAEAKLEKAKLEKKRKRVSEEPTDKAVEEDERSEKRLAKSGLD